MTFLSKYTYCQKDNAIESGSISKQQLENLTEQQEGETEDDSYIQDLIRLHENPINLNSADENEMH